MLLLEPSKKINQQLVKVKPKSLVVMSPGKVKPSMIKSLSRCEQPDVVLLHDVPAYFKASARDFITPFLGVGDYLLVDVSKQDVAMFSQKHENSSLLMQKVAHENRDGGFLALFKTGKKGLEVPRWTSSTKKVGVINYSVTSSFTEKKMLKEELKVTSNWEKGINLLTFVMLSGVYPPDTIIRNEIKALASVQHNDLVIGNILIQGTHLKPIDFNDKRHDISVKKCINALLEAFRKDRKKFKSPRDFHDFYRELLGAAN